jgi:FdhD protein
MPQPENGATPLHFIAIKSDGSASAQIVRFTIVEAAVAIEYNGIGYAVMMATPVDLHDYAIGFSLSEGLIESPDHILAIDIHETEMGWIVRIQVPNANAEKVIERARQRVSESSCGLCGMDNLQEVMRPLPPVSSMIDVPMRELQTLNAATGSAHAAAFCAPDGSIEMTREDVGRHNALDKLIGALSSAKINPSTGFILLTARCSLELVQKTILAQCPMLVTISAATDLAIRAAEKSGLRLVSLARPDAALVAMPQND